MRLPWGGLLEPRPNRPRNGQQSARRMGRGRRHAASPIASLNAARECAKAASPQRRARPRPCPPAGDLGQSRGKPTSPPCTVARPCPFQAVNRCLPTIKTRLAASFPGTPEGRQRLHPHTVYVCSPHPTGQPRALSCGENTARGHVSVAFVRCSTWDGLPCFHGFRFAWAGQCVFGFIPRGMICLQQGGKK